VAATEVVREDLAGRLRRAVERALLRGRKTFVSVTVPIDDVDPAAAVFASRLASDRWFCWEQPDRGFALAALGVAHEARSRGPERFRDVARECLAAETVSDEPPGLPAGAGAAWVLLNGVVVSTRGSSGQVALELEFGWRLFAAGMLCACIVGVAGGIAPAWRAVRLSVSDGLRVVV